MYRTPTTSAAKATTPSPAAPTSPAQDAAKTFIRRPERKRRSIDNMEIYRKQRENYTIQTNDRLLQEVMRTFEDIPSKVKEYPQMRKDIKTFLEDQSDKCIRILFELSKRVKSLETSSGTLQPSHDSTISATSGLVTTIQERLEKVETAITTRLSDLGEKLKQDLEKQTEHLDEGRADMLEIIIEKFEDAKTDMDHVTEGVRDLGQTQGVIHDNIVDLVEDVATIKDRVKEVAEKWTSEPKAALPTYASVAAARPGHRPALHSVAVTLEGNQETADEVLARVKVAVDARGTGLKINKVRKAKNQTVILGCESETELQKVKDMIEKQGKGLVVAPMVNKNPLVVVKDVFLDSSDEEMVKALHCQNQEVFKDLSEKEKEITVKYKKRTRNPKTAHIIMQVGPTVWQRMTEAGALYLDLQRVRVEDQSPLIQCTRCLAFGHGRKFCTESADKCSHCGGPHLREKCADFMSGSEPQCCNCSHSRLQRTDHNAFSTTCPVRQKWDYLARANTAYF